MNVLVTGISGLLGKSLYETAPADVNFCGTHHGYCPCPSTWMDILNTETIKTAFKTFKPDVVIHCAANGDVDYAEKNEEKSGNVNIKGTLNMMDACREHGAKLIYLSSNAVFTGDNPPYSETDERYPINKYGELKAKTEDHVVTLPDWLIIRPIMLYGWPFINSRSNFVFRCITQLEKGKEVKAVMDTVTQPTYAPCCAKAIWKLIEKKNQIYHIASEEKCSLYDIAKMTAKVFNMDRTLVKGVTSDHFPSIAPRPVDTTFNLAKLKKENLSCLDLEAGLRLMKEAKWTFPMKKTV